MSKLAVFCPPLLLLTVFTFTFLSTSIRSQTKMSKLQEYYTVMDSKGSSVLPAQRGVSKVWNVAIKTQMTSNHCISIVFHSIATATGIYWTCEITLLTKLNGQIVQNYYETDMRCTNTRRYLWHVCTMHYMLRQANLISINFS